MASGDSSCNAVAFATFSSNSSYSNLLQKFSHSSRLSFIICCHIPSCTVLDSLQLRNILVCLQVSGCCIVMRGRGITSEV